MSLGLGWSRLSETAVALVALFSKPLLDLQVRGGLVYHVSIGDAGGEFSVQEGCL
jgi:hypothetical protein